MTIGKVVSGHLVPARWALGYERLLVFVASRKACPCALSMSTASLRDTNIFATRHSMLLGSALRVYLSP